MRTRTLLFGACLLALLCVSPIDTIAKSKKKSDPKGWRSIGLSGGGAMFCPAISPVDPKLMMVNCDMSAAYISRDGGHNWEMIHAEQLGGNTRCRPAWHPTERDTLFAAGEYYGRLKVSHDAGKTFEPIGNLPNGLRGEIHICAAQPDLMFAGRQDETWRSEDAGKKWSVCSGPSGEVVGFVSGIGGLVWVATKQGIWRSDDDGKKWSPATEGLPNGDLLSISGSCQQKVERKKREPTLYCSVKATNDAGKYVGGVYRSDDLGNSWTSVMGGGINMDVTSADKWAQGDVAQYPTVLCTDVNPDIVWAFNTNTGVLPPHHTAAYRSEDGGKTWHATFFPDPRFKGYNVAPDYTTVGDGQFYQGAPENVAICPSDPDIVIQLDSGNCIITEDGGKTWFNGHTRQAKDEDLFENTGLVVTTTWHYYVDPHEPRRHYICYTDIGFARSLDGGETWHWWSEKEKAPWRNTCYDLCFDTDKPGRMWGAFSNVHDIPNDNIISGRHKGTGPGGVCHSEDFGEHWTPVKDLPLAPCTSIIRTQRPLDPTARKPKMVWTLVATLFGEGVYASTDDGKSWTRLGEIGSSANRRVYRVRADSEGRLFALVTALRNGGDWDESGPGLYRWDDDKWTRICDSLRWPKDFTIDPDNDNHILIGAADTKGEGAGLWETTDGGKKWACILRKGSQHFSASFSPFHKGWIYASLCEGSDGDALWLSKDGGKKWESFSKLPFRNIQRIEFDPQDEDEVIVTTFGGSIWRGPAEP
ncbi:MAG: exo-alpha-sialidase [Planctomycetes bacterium]|nr:exo-alpha-sialidase [Planctomycetota bacterium]